MSGPAEPSAGRALNANHMPSGEYAAARPTMVTSVMIAMAVPSLGCGLSASDPDGLAETRPAGSRSEGDTARIRSVTRRAPRTGRRRRHRVGRRRCRRLRRFVHGPAGQGIRQGRWLGGRIGCRQGHDDDRVGTVGVGTHDHGLVVDRRLEDELGRRGQRDALGMPVEDLGTVWSSIERTNHIDVGDVVGDAPSVARTEPVHLSGPRDRRRLRRDCQAREGDRRTGPDPVTTLDRRDRPRWRSPRRPRRRPRNRRGRAGPARRASPLRRGAGERSGGRWLWC